MTDPLQTLPQRGLDRAKRPGARVEPPFRAIRLAPGCCFPT